MTILTPAADSTLAGRLTASVRRVARTPARGLGAMVVLVAAAAGLAAAGAGTAATTPIATIYVTYGANCTFQLSADSIGPVTTGTVLPPGEYQVQTSSSVLYTSLSDPPCMPQFELSGPGVNVSIGFTSFGRAALIILQPSGSYVALDSFAPTVSTTFTASATGSSSSLVTTPTSTVPSTSTSSSLDPVGSALNTARVAYRGTLAATVAASGKPGLRFRGKAVSSLAAGRYSFVVIDNSHTGAFVLRKTHQAPIVLTGVSFTGKRTVSLTLTAGRYSFAPQADATGKTFVVTGH